MNPKTFRGSTMAETLAQVKRAFGRDAVILTTRTVPKGKLFGRHGRIVEITAARDLPDLPAVSDRGILWGESGHMKPTEGAVKVVPPPSNDKDAHPSAAILSEIGALRSTVHDLVRETRRSKLKDLPEELVQGYGKLVENLVAERIAQQLVNDVHRELSPEQRANGAAVRAKLAGAIERMLPTAGPIRPVRTGAPTTIALVGPTGVGKTTTIAKLAANHRLRENRKVGLITIDTYRIAAVEQLRTYAHIIEVPLKVVMTPAELRDAVASMGDCDMIFIDTAGRGQQDAAKIGELKKFFDAVRPDEVHLVLSGTCSEPVMLATLEGFSSIGIDRIILTKLDEAIGFGMVLSCLEKTTARLSYVTTGQDVPDDIHVGTGRTLAQLILGERSSLADCQTGGD